MALRVVISPPERGGSSQLQRGEWGPWKSLRKSKPSREEANDIFYPVKPALHLYKSLWALANVAWAKGWGDTDAQELA